MYKVTTDENIQKAYEDAIYDYNREFQLELLVDGKQIPSSDILDKITIDYDGMTNGVTVGEIIYPKLSFSVLSQHKIVDGNKVSVFISIKIKKPNSIIGTYDWLRIPFGEFEVESVESDKFKHTISTYANGYLKMQETFYPKSTQYTSSSLLAEISSNIGLVFEGFPNIELANEDIVTEGEDGNSKTEVGTNFVGHTYAMMIQLVVGACGGNAIFSRSGSIKFVPLSNSSISLETLKDFTEPTLGASYDKRKVSVLKRAEMPVINSGDIYASGLQILNISNPLILGQQQVDSLYNTIKSIKYTSISGLKCFNFPLHLEPLDNVSIELDGVNYLVPIHKMTISFAGGLIAELGSNAQSTTDNYTGTLTSQVDGLGKVTSKILHEQNKIELSVSHVKENYSTKEETNSKIEVAVGEITLEINKVNNTTEELKTLISLTEDEIRQEVVNVKNGLETNISTIAGQLKIDMDNKNAELKGTIEATYSRLSVLYNDNLNNLQSQIIATKNEITASVNDKTNNLQSQITATSNSISTKVSKGDIVSSINQSAENVKIKAAKIDLNGTVTVTGDNRYIKIEDANYSVFDGSIRKAYLGFRGVSGTDYVVPKFVLSATNTEGVAYEYFVVTPYKGNKENPQSTDYGYVDIAYHTNHYSASTGGDWSNVKLYANGDMRVSPIRKLEITTNFNNGQYGSGYERLVAEFRSDSHTWYNGNLSVGAVVNRTNGNGLILIDQHDHLGRQAGVRVQCNDDGGHSFRPLTNGECYNGTSNYRWKQIYAVKSTISTSDERHKVIFDNLDTTDCYDMIRNIPLYNYYMLGENKNNLTEEQIQEKMIDENKQLGLMAQDLLEYECGEYILDYEDDIYGINDNQLIQATIGALQEEIKLRDKQIDQLTNDLEELKQCVKLLMGGE